MPDHRLGVFRILRQRLFAELHRLVEPGAVAGKAGEDVADQKVEPLRGVLRRCCCREKARCEIAMTPAKSKIEASLINLRMEKKLLSIVSSKIGS